MEKMRSIRWTMTFGTNVGYELSAQKENTIDEVAEDIKTLAAKIMDETGVYVSCVLSPSRTLYHADWGCPVGGEFTYTAEGSCNTSFTELDKYMSALEKFVEAVKTHYNQSTVTLEVVEADVYYFN